MDKRGFLVAIAIIAVIILTIGFFIFQYVKNSSNLLNISNTTCSSQDDCVKVQTTCCPCSDGGQEGCVPKSKVKYYLDLRNNCSKELACATIYNCKNLSCGCVGEKCQ